MLTSSSHNSKRSNEVTTSRSIDDRSSDDGVKVNGNDTKLHQHPPSHSHANGSSSNGSNESEQKEEIKHGSSHARHFGASSGHTNAQSNANGHHHHHRGGSSAAISRSSSSNDVPALSFFFNRSQSLPSLSNLVGSTPSSPSQSLSPSPSPPPVSGLVSLSRRNKQHSKGVATTPIGNDMKVGRLFHRSHTDMKTDNKRKPASTTPISTSTGTGIGTGTGSNNGSGLTNLEQIRQHLTRLRNAINAQKSDLVSSSASSSPIPSPGLLIRRMSDGNTNSRSSSSSQLHIPPRHEVRPLIRSSSERSSNSMKASRQSSLSSSTTDTLPSSLPSSSSSLSPRILAPLSSLSDTTSTSSSGRALLPRSSSEPLSSLSTSYTPSLLFDDTYGASHNDSSINNNDDNDMPPPSSIPSLTRTLGTSNRDDVKPNTASSSSKVSSTAPLSIPSSTPIGGQTIPSSDGAHSDMTNNDDDDALPNNDNLRLFSEPSRDLSTALSSTRVSNAAASTSSSSSILHPVSLSSLPSFGMRSSGYDMNGHTTRSMAPSLATSTIGSTSHLGSVGGHGTGMLRQAASMTRHASGWSSGSDSDEDDAVRYRALRAAYQSPNSPEFRHNHDNNNSNIDGPSSWTAFTDVPMQSLSLSTSLPPPHHSNTPNNSSLNHRTWRQLHASDPSTSSIPSTQPSSSSSSRRERRSRSITNGPSLSQSSMPMVREQPSLESTLFGDASHTRSSMGSTSVGSSGTGTGSVSGPPSRRHSLTIPSTIGLPGYLTHLPRHGSDDEKSRRIHATTAPSTSSSIPQSSSAAITVYHNNNPTDNDNDIPSSRPPLNLSRTLPSSFNLSNALASTTTSTATSSRRSRSPRTAAAPRVTSRRYNNGGLNGSRSTHASPVRSSLSMHDIPSTHQSHHRSLTGGGGSSTSNGRWHHLSHPGDVSVSSTSNADRPQSASPSLHPYHPHAHHVVHHIPQHAPLSMSSIDHHQHRAHNTSHHQHHRSMDLTTNNNNNNEVNTRSGSSSFQHRPRSNSRHDEKHNIAGASSLGNTGANVFALLARSRSRSPPSTRLHAQSDFKRDDNNTNTANNNPNTNASEAVSSTTSGDLIDDDVLPPPDGPPTLVREEEQRYISYASHSPLPSPLPSSSSSSLLPSSMLPSSTTSSRLTLPSPSVSSSLFPANTSGNTVSSSTSITGSSTGRARAPSGRAHQNCVHRSIFDESIAEKDRQLMSLRNELRGNTESSLPLLITCSIFESNHATHTNVCVFLTSNNRCAESSCNSIISGITCSR
jgi:hypothetical protein